jgi:scyllo-inositol 2-dehydrogenase (NADP+)
MEPFRVGLIGYGLAGSAFHAPFIETIPELSLAAIVTRDEARREQARRLHPDAELLDSADDLWRRVGDFDLVVVGAPARVHIELATAAVEAGLPVVVEKPFAPSAAEARSLVETARQRDVLLTVFQNRRWDGDFLTVRRLIEQGELGEITRFESSFERWRPEVSPGSRAEDDPAEQGGVLLDLGSHLVDQALQLFGRVRSVYGEVDSRRPGTSGTDDAFVALTHESGVRTHLWMSAAATQSGPRFRVLGMRAGYLKYGLDAQEDALVAGELPGGPEWGREPEEAWGVVGAGDDIRPVPTAPGAYEEFYRGLVGSLRDGAPPPVEPQDAVSGLEVLEAARLSADEGRVVTPS